MSEQDWAEKKAKEIIKKCTATIQYHSRAAQVNVSAIDPELIEGEIVLSLKQEREIATLEMENKYKKIAWPSDEELRTMEEELRDEHGLLFSDGWGCGVEWLKEWVEESRK